MLQLELAAVADAEKSLVESTYNLEGDVALAWSSKEQLQVVHHSINAGDMPNLAQQCYQHGLAAVQTD